MVTLPRDNAAPLKLYYIKHGNLLLSRLPIAAGQERQLEVGVIDDTERLRAEGVVAGIRDRLVDTLARREIKAARITKQLDAPDLDETRIEKAQQLYQELQGLPGRNEFIREIQDRQREFFSGDKTTQNRIDRLFRDTRDVITRTLTTTTEDELAALITDTTQRLRKLRDYQAGEETPGSTVPPDRSSSAPRPAERSSPTDEKPDDD